MSVRSGWLLIAHSVVGVWRSASPFCSRRPKNGTGRREEAAAGARTHQYWGMGAELSAKAPDSEMVQMRTRQPAFSCRILFIWLVEAEEVPVDRAFWVCHRSRHHCRVAALTQVGLSFWANRRNPRRQRRWIERRARPAIDG